MKFLSKIKYPILKAIDVSGLTFLSPVVRLCYGEEPRVQVKKISQWILIPICAMALFVVVWAYGSKVVKTKSGSVPGPLATLKASDSIGKFGDYEKAKEDAYEMTGEERDQALKTPQARLLEMEPIITTANEAVKNAKEKHAADLVKRTSGLTKQLATLKESYDTSELTREAALAQLSTTLTPGDKSAYESFLSKVKEHTRKTDLEKEELAKLTKEIKEINDEKSDSVADALFAQTQAAEERQFLQKQIDQLTKQNKGLKIATAQEKIEADSANLLTLRTGE